MNTIDTIRAILTELGYDHSKLKMRVSKEKVGYPGGSYNNDQLVVTGKGEQRQYGIYAVVRTPQVAVNEIIIDFSLPKIIQ